MTNTETIKTTSLSIGYSDNIVAQDINISIGSGDMVALVGPNGAGKSTLFKTLSGHIKPLSGHVILDGREASTISAKDHAKILSIVLTERPDDIFLTVHDIVASGRYPYVGLFGKFAETDENKLKESLEIIGITKLIDRTFSTLSDGERQKVMIAKAIAQDTPVIFLDEPTAFLDYPSKIELFTILSRLSREQNKTIIFSTHDLELLLRYTDNLWVMGKNKPFIAGKSSELLNSGIVKEYFNLKEEDNEWLKRTI